MNSARSPRPLDTRGQMKASPRPGATLDGVETKRSPRSDAVKPSQRLDSKPETTTMDYAQATCRSNPAASEASMDTYRTSMSTARVQTALAALNAEKQALLVKLQSIDATLESDEKKRSTIPRVRKK